MAVDINPSKLQCGTGPCSSLGSRRDFSKEVDIQKNCQCVEHYDTTTYVADDDSIPVRLPLFFEVRPSTQKTAKKRFFALEQKLKDRKFEKRQYHDFIEKYLDMGHLQEAPQTSGLRYYVPHCQYKPLCLNVSLKLSRCINNRIHSRTVRGDGVASRSVLT